MTTMTYNCRLLTALAAFCCVTVFATVPEELQEKLNTEVTKELDQAIADLVNPDYVAKELFLKAPVEPPKKPLDLLFQQIEVDIAKTAQKKYPHSEIARFHSKAEELYPLKGPGDIVEVTFADASKKPVKGPIRSVDQNTVVIHNNPIPIKDLSDASRTFFDGRNAAVKRESYVRARTAEWEEQRRQYRESLRDARRREVLNTQGYIRIRGDWISRHEYLSQNLIERRKMLLAKLEPLAIHKVYYANGLVFFREQWMTAEEAEEIKRLLAEAAAARAAEEAAASALNNPDAASPDDDPFGEENKPPPPKPKEDDLWDDL
jgi:hypothetical protein